MLKATLIKEFHITLAEFGRLTPREVQEVYLHPRNKDGDLKAPVVAVSDPIAQLQSAIGHAEMMDRNHPGIPRLRQMLKEMINDHNRKSADSNPV